MVRLAARLTVAASLLAVPPGLLARSKAVPVFLLVALAGAALPLARAWRGAVGTALRPALVWAAVAIGLAALSEVVALTEPFATGRPATGQVVYLSTLATFAALLSVLNARTPGGGAWAILMALLVVVFLVPWLEGASLVREGGGWDRLRLTAPWTIFYGLLVVAGVTNYLPTRLGPAAVVIGLGLVAEFVALTSPGLAREAKGVVWLVVPYCWAWSAWLADLSTRRRAPARSDLGRLWAWFRDAWGVVWALRVQERFNRAADSGRWPIRLSWHGVVPAPTGAGVAAEPATAIPEAAAITLASLLRRFATAERLAEAAALDPEQVHISGSKEPG